MNDRRATRLRPVGRRTARAWAEVRINTSASAAAAVAAALWDLGVAGVVEEPLDRDAVRLRAYLHPSGAGRPMLRRLRARVRGLSRFGLDPGAAAVSRRTVTARMWTRRSRSARPFRVGPLVVAPRRVRVPARAGQTIIRIDPGMAFGSGEHPSTQLGLRALIRHLPGPRRRARVVDVGTGSGILAIAAFHLGAARVWARDVDPVAVAVARENVRANAAAAGVHVVRGAGVGPRPVSPHLVIANIVAATIAELLPDVAARLRPGGVFIGSGIIADQLPSILRAASAARLARVEVLASGEWRAVVFARTGMRRRRGTPVLITRPKRPSPAG